MTESVAVQIRVFSVRANGIRVENINIANQPRAIESLQTAKAYLHPGLKIPKLALSMKAVGEKKVYSTLHIEVATAATANRLITEGPVEDYEIKEREHFTRGLYNPAVLRMPEIRPREENMPARSCMRPLGRKPPEQRL